MEQPKLTPNRTFFTSMWIMVIVISCIIVQTAIAHQMWHEATISIGILVITGAAMHLLLTQRPDSR